MRPPWTRTARLPGGDIPVTSFDEWTLGVALRYPSLDPALLHRLCRAFGSRVDTLLAGVTKPADIAETSAPGLRNASSTISSPTNGPKPPTMSCGVAGSSAC